MRTTSLPRRLPATVRAFLTQQHRWAKGTVQTARKPASAPPSPPPGPYLMPPTTHHGRRLPPGLPAASSCRSRSSLECRAVERLAWLDALAIGDDREHQRLLRKFEAHAVHTRWWRSRPAWTVSRLRVPDAGRARGARE